MRYIIDMSPETDNQIRDLIKQQRYVSIYQFISRAIEEMLHIEHQDVACGSATEPVRSVLLADKTSNLLLLKRPELEPELLSSPHKLSDLYDGDHDELPWLWGQINSVLCIKFVLRALEVRQIEMKSEPLKLSEVASLVEEPAVKIGEYLIVLDNELSLPRDKRLSLSFPKNTERSRRRFISQYVGYLNSRQRPCGALAWLSFARISGKRGAEIISLTPGGFHFGKLFNPLIDGEQDRTIRNVLTREESQFYIRHVLDHALCEATALKTICRLIQEGHNQPRTMECALKALRPEWSEAEVITYKGGALARLNQLGVIIKSSDSNGKLFYKLEDWPKKTGLI